MGNNEIIYILEEGFIYSACFKPEDFQTYEAYSCLQKNTFSRYIFNKLYKIEKIRTILYNSKLKNHQNATFILFNSIDDNFLKWLREIYPQNRIIIYFIDTVDSQKKLPEKLLFFKELSCELWSFDKGDCEKYKMKFNERYYSCFVRTTKKVKYDAVFIGREKNRRKELNSLKEYFDSKKMKYLYHITHERNYPIINPFKYKHQIKYSKMIELERCSRAVIELVSEGQNGTTLRMFDAIFNEIKLITNYSDIVHSEFYNENNIYIIKNNNYEGLDEFLDKPYLKYGENVLKKYSFETWISNFGLSL